MDREGLSETSEIWGDNLGFLACEHQTLSRPPCAQSLLNMADVRVCPRLRGSRNSSELLRTE